MFVRVIQRLPLIPAVALAAFAIAHPTTANAQETSQVPESHTVKRGDTLWDLAKLYLGDSFLWPEIYRHNTDVIEDPHWIYPGEVLKLRGITARVVAVTPPPAANEPPPAVVSQPQPVTQAPAAAPVRPSEPQRRAASSVRVGEYAASPWVDQEGGPRGYGRIMESGDIPGIASADRSRISLHEKLFFAPPAGAEAANNSLLLSYRLGPFIEGFGQIVIPTGIIEVTRSARNGEAGTGRVVTMFDEVLQGNRLIPYDSTAALVAGGPTRIEDGARPTGKVRWILTEPVLPSLQSYVVVDLSRRQGLATGDEIELYMPRTGPRENETLMIPEISIAHGQVLRVTPYGATAIITRQEQPRIQPGTAARVSAKMQ